MSDSFAIEYALTLPDGKRESFAVHLDRQTLDLQRTPPEAPPVWTNLEFHQCSNCPLRPDRHPQCPLASSLSDVVQLAGQLASYTEVDVVVTVPERTVHTHTTAQRALASLMGLLIATSGCPHTTFFRPMARFHLPFASEEETIYRATSSWLLGQYMARTEGRAVPMNLDGLLDIYENMQVINRQITRRLWAAVKLDASVNAVVLLDLFGKALPLTVDDQLAEIRYLFGAWLDRRGTTPPPELRDPDDLD